MAIFQRGAADGLERRGAARREGLLRAAAHHLDSAALATATARRWRHRPRRLLRPASLARAVEAAVRSAAPGDRRCGRFARPHALAFRRAGLHGIGHAGPEGHRQRLDESRAAEARRQSRRRCARWRWGRLCRAPCGATQSAVSMQSIGAFQVRDQQAAMEFQQMYQASKDPVLQATARETFEAMSMLQAIQKQPYTPAAGAEYPRAPLGESLKQIAQLIKADVGMEMAFADIGDWDHHVQGSGAEGLRGPARQSAAQLRTGAERLLDGYGRPHAGRRAW